jgi:hypothetical protein
MKQLIKELIYRTIYTTIALSTIMGFIYLTMRVKWNTYGQYTIWIQNALILLV